MNHLVIYELGFGIKLVILVLFVSNNSVRNRYNFWIQFDVWIYSGIGYEIFNFDSDLGNYIFSGSKKYLRTYMGNIWFCIFLMFCRVHQRN